MEIINTLLADMPVTIKAYTISNSDSSYTIVLNSRINHEQLMQSYQHEIYHIHNGDYETDAEVGLIELFAHASVNPQKP